VIVHYYSPPVFNEEAITILIEKDTEYQKEKIEKLISFKKGKYGI
jgi:hypothetical protein